MSKFLVETYYTCSFKIIHELTELTKNNYQILIIDKMEKSKLLT